MLEKQRCPHTGVVNFFAKSEPLLAIGSIVESPPGRFVWRSHIADDRFGKSPDAGAAELELVRALAQAHAAKGLLQTDSYDTVVSIASRQAS